MKKISKSFLAAGICAGVLLVGSLTICAVKHSSLHSLSEVIVNGDVVLNGEVNGISVDDKAQNGPVKEVKFKVGSNISAIRVSNVARVVFTQVSKASEVGVTAQIPENLVKFFDVTEKGEGITIGLSEEGKKQKNLRINKNSVPTFYVSALALKTVDLSGASDLVVKGTLITRGEELRWNASGSSDIHIGFLNANQGKATFRLSGSSDLEIKQAVAENLTINASGASDADIADANLKSAILQASGSSDIKIKGRAGIVALEASGASDIDAEKLIVENGTANASGASEIECNVANLSQSSSGSSSVKNKR